MNNFQQIKKKAQNLEDKAIKNGETIMNIAKKHFEEKDDTLFINTDDMSYFVREISEIMLLS